MSNPFEARFLGATIVPAPALGGASFPFRVNVPANCVAVQMKALTGTTVMILPNQISGASVGGATSLTNVNGYPLTIGQDSAVYGPVAFYLAASAAGTVAMNFFFSSGATLL